VDDQQNQPLPIDTDSLRAFMAQYQARQRKKRQGISGDFLTIESGQLLITESGQPLTLEN
jgi:hypothetical protein